MADTIPKSTSFSFTEAAKKQVGTFKTATGLTQPKIINRILEKVSAEQVTEWCSDLIEEEKSKHAESKKKAEQLAKLSKLDSSELDQLINGIC